MKLVIGGYMLELDQAKEWADQRFPGKMRWRHRLLVDQPINAHLQYYFDPDGKQRKHDRCILVPWEQNSLRVCFPTIWTWNPPKEGKKSFQEDDTARSIKKELFEFEQLSEKLEYLQDIPFVTIYDPFKRV
ncbi:hypothetical protein PAXINDRAFT_17713 [Paxillus involutus ATCC 200175]|uniref:Uncharacterized protein n=1 Tax=Paxillus involutus ATCC 200175 TaxID=664439 RepID=A0A0C9TPY0_PAXIN|nr:hypothetical protein PAXINDRAFT_17713 [Paxillus involutus ATCC 200175]